MKTPEEAAHVSSPAPDAHTSRAVTWGLSARSRITWTNCSRHTPCAVTRRRHTACAYYGGIEQVIPECALTAAILAACILSATRAEAPQHPAGLPAECTEKVDATPDLCQTDEAFRTLPFEGKYSCGPTAVANVLLAMDQRGYGSLVEGDLRSKDTQRTLLEQLSEEGYLHTTRQGIGPLGAMTGLKRFVQDRGYRATLEWKGWRRAGPFSTGRFVDARWLREGVAGDSGVVLNVGWYRHDDEKDLYSRQGGHYMTLVGYRQEGQRFTYLIHDPASRSGPGKVTHEAQLVPLRSGRLAPWKSYAEQQAAGHFLVEGVVVKRTADVAILDGAIRITIAREEGGVTE
jgi:hypothetical protein